MASRLPIRASICAATCLLAVPAAHGQLVTMTDRDAYASGQPIVVQLALTNATMAPAQYSTNNGATEVRYTLRRVNVDDPVQPATFEALLNGEPVEVRQLDFTNGVGGVSGGTIGPGKSVSLGGTLGFALPVDLLQGYPPTYGATILLTDAANHSIEILEGDRIELRSSGVYHLTTVVSELTINGYRYDASTGHLTTERLLRVTARPLQPTGPSTP